MQICRRMGFIASFYRLLHERRKLLHCHNQKLVLGGRGWTEREEAPGFGLSPSNPCHYPHFV